MARPNIHSGNESVLKMLGAAVRELRQERSLSQEAFADLAGLDRSYMGGIERGEHNLTVMSLLRIATALDCKASVLMSEADV